MFEDDVMKMKDKLRKSIGKKRNTLSASEVLEKSSRIKKRILKWTYLEMHKLFYSMCLMVTKYTRMI